MEKEKQAKAPAQEAPDQKKDKAMEKPALKKGKKKWVAIMAPKEFNQVHLGETYVFEQEQAVGKCIEANLMALTHDAKKQNAKVKFVVNEVRNNQGFTALTGYEMLNAHVRRMTKKAKGKIDVSFIVATSDKVHVEVKPLLLTRTRTHKSILSQMQKDIRTWMAELARKQSYSQFMGEVISGAVQRDMKTVAKKLYPVTTCVVRVAQRVQ